MKRVVKVFVSLVLILCLVVVGVLVMLGVTDYDPDEIVTLDINNNVYNEVKLDESYSMITWNIGYSSLGAKEDFFYDGGVKSKPDNKDEVEKYLSNIINTITSFDADFLMVQEIDIDSDRSYNLNQLDALNDSLGDYSNSLALNYVVKYIPIPFPPMGKVNAGQGIYSKYMVDSSTRYALPGKYSWPKNLIMLDRCMLVSRLPVKDRDGELVIINTHFSAYDDGSIRELQLEYAKRFILEEYSKGNYVILGGDWNQTFPDIDTDKYPMLDDGAYYTPYKIPSSWLEDGWRFAVSDNAPTYRLLNEPYVKGTTQIGVIDGFLISPNVVNLDTEVIDLGFKDSDHNPVKLVFELK